MRIGQLEYSRQQFNALFRGCDYVGAARWLALSTQGSKQRLTVTVHGHPIVLRASSTDLEVALDSFGGEFDILCKAVPVTKHDFIIDAGGYIGTAAILLAERYPTATVISLEPSKSNFELLVRNTARLPNVVPLNLALSSEPGVVDLRNRRTGEWGFTIVADPEDAGECSVIEQVYCVTVPALLDQFRPTGIDIFKIDIEGAERQLFARDTEWIDRTTALFIELHDRIANGCSQVFHSACAGRRNTQTSGEKILSLRH